MFKTSCAAAPGLLRSRPLLLIAVVLGGLAACGGGNSSGASGSGGSTSTSPPAATVQTTVSGIAASGKPIAGATVTVKDASGNSATGTTAADGTFKVTSTTKFTPPLLVQVGQGAGAALYSVSADSNLTTTINVTPLTDLVVRSYYDAQGVTADTAFGALAANPPPTASTVQILGNAVQGTVQLWLINAGVATANFNLISTPFTADSTGIDKVLDETTVNSTSGKITITDGTTTQTSTLTAASGTVTIATSTTNTATNTASQSQQTVAVPTSSTQQTDLGNALAGVKTLFTNLISTASTKGATLATADVSPFIDTAFLSQGQNASAYATNIVNFLSTLPAGVKLSFSGFVRVNRFADTSATQQTLNVTVDLLETLANGSTVHNYIDNSDDVGSGMVYRLQSDGSWRLYGDQGIAKAHVQAQQVRFYDANVTAPDTPSNGLELQAQVSVATGTLTSVSLSGSADSLPDCSGITTSVTPAPMTLASVVLTKDSGLFNGQDRYDLPCPAAFGDPVISSAPMAGTPYTFSLTPVSTGTAVTQSSTLNSATTDNGDFVQINAVSRSSFAAANTVAAIAGKTLTVTFTPPTTFPVLYSYLTGFCQNGTEQASGGGSDSKGAHDNIPPGTNSDTIVVPATCDGAPIAGYNLNVWFVGVNGEKAYVGQNFHF